MADRLDVDDPFGDITSSALPGKKDEGGIELDVEDPFAPTEQAIPTEEPKESRGKISELLTGIPAGIVGGIKRGIPKMAAGAIQYQVEQMVDPRAAIERSAEEVGRVLGEKIELPSWLKAHPIVKEISAPTEEAKKYYEQKEEQYFKEHPEYAPKEKITTGALGYQIGEMAAESLGTAVGLRKAAMVGASRLIHGARAAEAKAAQYVSRGLTNAAQAEGQKALDLTARYVARQAIAGKVSNIGTAGLFGLSQAQQTIDNAKQQGVAPGLSAILTGVIEGVGEYFGTKYLNRLLKVSETGFQNSIKEFIKTTFGVEVSTEMLQNGLEAAVEKITGVRPSAEPIGEALSAVLPTAGMSILTMGLASGAHKAAKAIDAKVNRWNEAQKKSTAPINLTQPQPVAPQFVPRAVEKPMTRAEKEYSDWWNKEIRAKEMLRQSPEGRTKLAEQLAEEAGQRATVAGEQERRTTAKEIERIRRAEAERQGKSYADFMAGEIAETEKAQEGEFIKKLNKVKAGLAESRREKKVQSVERRMKSVAQTTNAKEFGRWIDQRAEEMNQAEEGTGTTWRDSLATQYDLDPKSKNFVSQLKRAITAEAKITGIAGEKLAEGEIPTKKVSPKEKVSPPGEARMPIETKGKPYEGLKPGTKAWKKVWKEHPAYQKEMSEVAKGMISPEKVPSLIEETEEVERPEEEVVPKHQALKMIKRDGIAIAPNTPMNQIYDVFDGLFHLSQAYGIEDARDLLSMDDEANRQAATRIMQIWDKVSGGMVFNDMQNQRQDIKDKLIESNKVIEEIAKTAKPLVIPKETEEERRGRPRKEVNLEPGEKPTDEMPKNIEETTELIDDLEEEIGDIEPTEEELKEEEAIVDKMLEDVETPEQKAIRKGKWKRIVHLYKQAKKYNIEMRQKTWDEIENDIAELIDGVKEEKEAEVAWKGVGEAYKDFEKEEPGKHSISENLLPLSEGTEFILDGKQWEFFFNFKKPESVPINYPGKPYNGLIPGTPAWLEEKNKQTEKIQKEMTALERGMQHVNSLLAHTNAFELLQESIRINERNRKGGKLDSIVSPLLYVMYRKYESALRQIKVIVKNNIGEASHYDSINDLIVININTKSGTMPDLHSTIAHETAHALSTWVLRYDTELQKQFIDLMEKTIPELHPDIQRVLKEIRRREAAYKDDAGRKLIPYMAAHASYFMKDMQEEKEWKALPWKVWDIAYAYTTVYEFLAQAFNSHHFRAYAKQVMIKPEKESMLRKLVKFLHQAIFKVPATDENYSMWDKIMEMSYEEVFPHYMNTSRERWGEKAAQGLGTFRNENLTQIVKNIKDIGDTNIDVKSWQKYIPMHILGKYYDSAKQMLHAWQEGQRTLNRLLYQYEYTVDPDTGKQRVKSFLTLSHPLKPGTSEQKLFDRMMYEGDFNHREMTMDDLRGFNRTMELNISQDKLDTVQHAYESIRRHYTRFWNWYWDNVQKVALRPYENKAWYTELVETMLDNETQITPAVESSVRALGDIEWRRFERARNNLLKAWDAIAKSRASMVEGYMPRMRQQGAYRVNIKDATGNIIATEFATNRTKAAMVKYRMEKQYPGMDSESFHVSTSPENVFHEFDKKDLEAFIRTITDVMERAGEADEFQIDEFYNALSNHIANKFKSTGFRTHQIQRVGQAAQAIQGYKTDNLHENILAYVRNGAGSIRKMNFAFDANNILREVKIQKKLGQSELFKYLKQYRDDMLRNEIAADKFISQIRSIAFLYYLAGNIKASAVNATQNFILGIPIYLRTMRTLGMGYNPAFAVKELHKATADVFKYKLGKTDHLTPEERDVLYNGKMDGDTGAMQMSYMSGAMDRSMGSRYGYIVNLLGTPFSTVETVNRESAMLAFYRLYRSMNMPEGMAYVRARDRMYDVHFPYGKHNYPELVRAKGLLGNLGHLLSTFRSYSIMYVSTICESFRGADGQVSWKNADVFFGSLALLVLLGGISAPWVDDILDTYERWSGRPVRAMIRERLRGIGGERFAWVGMHGIPALIGIDITGSLKIGVPLIGAGGVEETITGAYGGLEQKIGKGYEAFSVDNYYRAIEEWSPTFISNALKGLREYREGATNIDGTKVTDPRMNQYKPTAPEAALQAVGFRIERRANISEELRTFRNVETHMAKRRDNIYAKFRTAKPEERRAMVSEIRQYNDDAQELGNAVPKITGQSLKRVLTERFDRRRFLFEILFNEPSEDVEGGG